MINPNCIIDFRNEQGSWTWGFLVAFDKVGWKNCCWTFTHMITYPYHRKHHDLGILPIWIEIFFQIFLLSNAWNRSPLTLAVRNLVENIFINCLDKTWNAVEWSLVQSEPATWNSPIHSLDNNWLSDRSIRVACHIFLHELLITPTLSRLIDCYHP